MKQQHEQNKAIKKVFIDKAEKTVFKLNMINKGDRVLVGVSGGPDSVALLRFFLEIKLKYSLEIGIAHLNHMLRGREADRDEEFVARIANGLNIPFYTDKKDVKGFAERNHLSVEDSARKIRYSFLKNVFAENKYSKIALGHNSDDDAELILMNILRGSGTTGLAGIPPIREKVIIRPFIRLSKMEILSFLEAEGQSYVMDSSNNENIYLRNSIRNRLIPLIEKEYNPKIKESLLRLSAIIKDENDWMERDTEIVFNKALKNQPLENVKHGKIDLDMSVLKKSHPALIKRIVRKAIKMINGNLKRISSKHIEDIVKLLLSTTSGQSIDLPDQIRVFRKGTSLFVKKEAIPLRELGQKRKAKRNR